MSVWQTNPWALASAALVDIVTGQNTTFSDAFQFDPPFITGAPPPPYFPFGASGPTWTFAGQNFRMSIKGYLNQTGPSLVIDSLPANGVVIQIDDSVNRILHFNVPDNVLSGTAAATGVTGPGLVPGQYIYDFFMYDGSSPPIRVPLMRGKFVLQAGVGNV